MFTLFMMCGVLGFVYSNFMLFVYRLTAHTIYSCTKV